MLVPTKQGTSQVGKLVQKKCHSNAVISKLDLISYFALHSAADIIQYMLIQWLAQRSQASSSCNDHANDNRISAIRILCSSCMVHTQNNASRNGATT